MQSLPITHESLPADLPTPCLVVDDAIVNANLTAMATYCRENQLRLRPHTKTHKSIHMANRQIALGAQGLTVAKAGEAEVMSRASHDLLIAYPAIGPARLAKLTALAKQLQLTLAIDSCEAADHLHWAALHAGVTFQVLVDLDVGFHRTGVANASSALQLAEYCQRQSHLRVAGLLCFPGHLQPGAPDSAWQDYAELVGESVESFQRRGIPVDVVSGGSTPTARSSHRNPWLTEIRPGTYIYNDRNEIENGDASLAHCAARVVATVVSHCGKQKMVIDAGSKMLSSDRCQPAPDSGFGLVVEYPDAKITRLSEEHGEVLLPPHVQPADIGSRITIIPNHICPCVNLQDRFYLWVDGRLDLHQVDARGMVV